MGNEIDANVEDFFSKFDNEEETLVDHSDSSSEKEDTSKDSGDTQKKENEDKEKKEDTSKDSEDIEKAEDKETPFHKHPRWQQKLQENRELKDKQAQWEKEKQELTERLELLENAPKTDEEIENMTPREAMEYARSEAKREYEKNQLLEKQKLQEADRYIEESLTALKDAGEQFDENKLLKYADDYTGGNIEKAYDLYKRLETTKEEAVKQAEKEEAKKKAAQSNSSNRGKSGSSGGFVSGTSWGDLDLK